PRTLARVDEAQASLATELPKGSSESDALAFLRRHGYDAGAIYRPPAVMPIFGRKAWRWVRARCGRGTKAAGICSPTGRTSTFGLSSTPMDLSIGRTCTSSSVALRV